jgi:transcriptional regulator with XRE-family HTH domain
MSIASNSSFEKARPQDAGAKSGHSANALRQDDVQVSFGKSAGTFTGKTQGIPDRNLRGAADGNIRVHPTRLFRGPAARPEYQRVPAFELTQAEWTEIIAEAIRAYMREENLSVKELARDIGCNDRTAENYVQGRTAPAGLHLLRCIAVIPSVEAEVRRISAMAGDCQPGADRAAMELMRAAQKFLDVRSSDSPQSCSDSDTTPVVADLFARVA